MLFFREYFQSSIILSCSLLPFIRIHKQNLLLLLLKSLLIHIIKFYGSFIPYLLNAHANLLSELVTHLNNLSVNVFFIRDRLLRFDIIKPFNHTSLLNKMLLLNFLLYFIFLTRCFAVR